MQKTPLRRTSQGSLFAASRSQAPTDPSHALGSLNSTMAEFADEAEAMQTNVEGLIQLADLLDKFNEAFASWLYVMDINALTVDWPEAPSQDSFILNQQRAVLRAQAAAEEAAKEMAAAAERERERSAAADRTAVEITRIEQSQINVLTGINKPPTVVKKKKPVKAKMSAKEKKERSMEIEKVISSLPLEFRGSDPNLRRSMESVIEGLLDAPNQTAKLQDLIKPPDLSQARVNKCLIALVNRKVVQKDNTTGQVLYCWQGTS